MSTYMYLECQSHDPPLSSHDEVGQHTYDLPDIKKYLASREHFIANAKLNLDIDYGSHWVNTAAHFIAQHPNCKIVIRDEYGRIHE